MADEDESTYREGNSEHRKHKISWKYDPFSRSSGRIKQQDRGDEDDVDPSKHRHGYALTIPLRL